MVNRHILWRVIEKRSDLRESVSTDRNDYLNKIAGNVFVLKKEEQEIYSNCYLRSLTAWILPPMLRGSIYTEFWQTEWKGGRS